MIYIHVTSLGINTLNSNKVTMIIISLLLQQKANCIICLDKLNLNIDLSQLQVSFGFI